MLVASLSWVPALAQAHPGHGTGADFTAGAIHPLVGADHLLALVAVGLLAWRMGGVARAAISTAFPALIAAGATLGLAGFELALGEFMILASLGVLGLLALKPPRRLPVATVCVTACFAVFHGQAHGLEAATGTAGPAFIAGLTAASAGVICATLWAAQFIRPRMPEPGRGSVDGHHRHRLRRQRQ
jgi:urease accessory protein